MPVSLPKKLNMEQYIIVNLCGNKGIEETICLNKNKSSKENTFALGYENFHYDFGLINPTYNDILPDEHKRSICEMFTTRSCLYRADYYINDVERRIIWNSIVMFCPKCEHKYVYRYLNFYDKFNVTKGEIIKIEHSLTTTTIGRRFTPKYNYIGKYIIRCRAKRFTKAHNVSVLRVTDDSHEGEKQVNFEEGTSFKIDNIKQVHGKPYIYMHEI